MLEAYAEWFDIATPAATPAGSTASGCGSLWQPPVGSERDSSDPWFEAAEDMACASPSGQAGQSE